MTQRVTDRDANTELAVALDAGAQALARSIEALTAAADRFDSSLRALELLLQVRGRVVVTGLGKSGLVGTKLAATLASTGTPAHFVHAADALHGDAGMVTEGDLLLAISKSGETPEVIRFAELVKRRGAVIVTMTGCDGASSLASLADACIDAGVESEADPWDLVPTTSTQVTAALGDALAVALMVARGFGPADFHAHHPGGALGARLEDEGSKEQTDP
jgi:arabinose-5-phosphate isomerase